MGLKLVTGLDYCTRLELLEQDFPHACSTKLGECDGAKNDLLFWTVIPTSMAFLFREEHG